MEPQLLTVVEKETLETWAPDEWAKWQIEPKRDGFRLLIVDGIPQSRSGKPLHNIQHILDELGDELLGTVFDGELHGDTWEQTSHVARASKSERDEKLTYTIFDMLTLNEWQCQISDPGRTLIARQELMQKYTPETEHVKFVVPIQVARYSEFEIVHKINLAAGCDGTVLKRKDSLYEFKRTKTWLKVKPSLDFDAQIVALESGKGKYSNTLGKLICCHNGVEFGCSGMTDAQRHEWWNNHRQMIGKMVEVTCRGFHKSGAPIEPRFSRLRTDLI
jgi:DNA ligase-1